MFKVPEVNFEAQNYGDMITWTTEYINDGSDDNGDSSFFTSYTEPPVLCDFTKEDLQHVVEAGKLTDKITGLPCHNQRVERAIKLVSQTSQKSTKKKEREGIIQTVISSRKELPKFETKKQFSVKWSFQSASTDDPNKTKIYIYLL